MEMTRLPTQIVDETVVRYRRNGRIITLILMITTVPTAALFAYFGFVNNLPLLFIPTTLLLLTTVFDFLPLIMLGRGQHNTAMLLVCSVFFINVLVVIFIVQGLGPIIAASIILVILAAASLAMTPNYSVYAVLSALTLGVVAVLLDIYLGTNRIEVPQLAVFTPYIVAAIGAPIIFSLIREFNNFSLQIKVTLGILFTGAVIVASLMFFGLARLQNIIDFLSTKYEGSVIGRTESEILGTVETEADSINASLAKIASDLQSVANYRAGLERQRTNFEAGLYWNASEKLFQLPGGQIGNSKTDPASIFIPSTRLVDEEMLRDLNTSIYLDFLMPGFLEAHPEVIAVYYISEKGYTVYYPNIDLANSIEPGFDPTQEDFFTIASPEANPERLPKWTKAYQDPAGNGLIVTLSLPVYTQTGVFKGVVSADIPIAKIAYSVSAIKLGETDFAFLVDKNGFILYMPEAGYQLFGLLPEEVPVNKNPTLSIFDTDSQIMQFAAQRILINSSKLMSIRINNVDTYLAISTLETTGDKLVILAPGNELNRQILASRDEVQLAIDNALENASIILIALFIGALVVSLGVGQVITRPMKRLTKTVEEITGGNLSARVNIESQDETGILAHSFNTMADKLNETLHGLEDRIAERTRELEKINAANVYRAAQFESIARISSTISSAQSLERLLPQITETISEQLGFYHVGIFLVDVHKEFAVLAAANSEGGRRMLERNHRLRVGEVGLVGYVTRSGEPRLALDVGKDSVFFNNPFLPETHSEIAVPLLVGAEVIGALDVQSTETNAFSQEDVNILSSLADQVSIAIQNARSYQQSKEALEQAELAAAQLSEQQWAQFLAKQNIQGYHFDGVDATRTGADRQNTAQGIAIPLILRGTQIGTLRLSASDPDRVWDDDELALVHATAERTALAIENARLLQEAQRRAAKEETIGQISDKIGRLVNLDNILKTTLQELGSTLPGTDIAIQFLSGKSEQ